MKKYKIIGNGRRPEEKIVAILDENGYVHKVASGWYDHKKGVYKLYPTSHPFYQSISVRMNVDFREVDYSEAKGG